MGTHRPQPVSRGERGRAGVSAFLVLAVLLAVPGYAVGQLASSIDWRVLAGVPLALSTVAFFAYRSDKRRAAAGAWRIPEATLHFMALMGGWPGAFLAQRAFRHKTSKVSFQVLFWLVVLSHQLLAVDSLLDWRLTKDAWRIIKASP
jgi:uncharacterized membrane protein YsdA (DUF1294 family)